MFASSERKCSLSLPYSISKALFQIKRKNEWSHYFDYHALSVSKNNCYAICFEYLHGELPLLFFHFFYITSLTFRGLKRLRKLLLQEVR